MPVKPLVVVYTQVMAKKSGRKKSNWRKSLAKFNKKHKPLVLGIFAVIGVGMIVLVVLTIVAMPKINPGSQYGVGANGFRAYEEKDTSLGVDKVVSKEEVVQVLGGKAKSVSDADVSNVFNFNGDRGQTATYDFVRSDGVKATLYVDMMLFKNIPSMNNAHILTGTGDAGKVNGHPAYYMHAQTIGSQREYRLLVVNGLKAYKFVITQPYRNITINEVAALAALKKLAQKAEL